MHCGTLHDTCQDREMAVLCFPIPLLHQDGLVPFLTVERQQTTGFPSCYIFTLSCLISCALSHLSFIPLLFCLWMFSLALCCLPSLPVFCSLSLFLSLLSLRSASPPSSQLSCSGIVPDHSTSKYLLLTVALCSPHLDHVILKSEGTTLQISMSACLRQRGEKRQRAGEGESYVTHSQASEINAL